MEQKVIFSQVPIDEFLDQVRAVIREEIKAEKSKDVEEKLLSPAEACKVFQPAIVKQTLTTWDKEGWISSQKIKGKVFYKLSDLITAGKTLKKYKPRIGEPGRPTQNQEGAKTQRRSGLKRVVGRPEPIKTKPHID